MQAIQGKGENLAMAVTIELAPEFEAQLREEAARAGLDADTFIRKTLEERVLQGRPSSQGRPPLSPREMSLLQGINQGLPAETWQRYHTLVAQRRAETLTSVEQTELIGLSDQIEVANARRMAALAELARLRQTSLEEVMAQLGIKNPGYA